jgi:polysaccharide export outer membrane protein
MDPTEVPVTRLPDAVDVLPDRHPGDYSIGPGDKLNVAIFARTYVEGGEPEEVIVRQDGKIYLNLLGEVQAAGLTINQLQQAITQAAESFVKQPFVQITVMEYNSQYVTVFGELGGGQSNVGRAIRLPLQGPTRLVELLTTRLRETGQAAAVAAASPSVLADLSNIIVTRRTGERWRINLNTFLFGLNTASNVEIHNGDFIFIPSLNDNRVFVLGEVGTPGPIPIGLGMTATEAVVRAGGFTQIARRNDVKVIRGGMQNPEVISAPVLEVASKGRRGKDIWLRNGDIVYIPRNPLGDINLILQQILPPIQTYLLIQALVNQ